MGSGDLGLDGLLRAPLKKTAESVLRMFDIWVPVSASEGRLAEIRVVVCLEDLGPETGALAQNVNPPNRAQ